MSRDHGTGLFKIENLARGTAEAMPDGTLDGKLVSIHLKDDIAKIEKKKNKEDFFTQIWGSQFVPCQIPVRFDRLN